jgi:hypothetical protein
VRGALSSAALLVATRPSKFVACDTAQIVRATPPVPPVAVAHKRQPWPSNPQFIYIHHVPPKRPLRKVPVLPNYPDVYQIKISYFSIRVPHTAHSTQSHSTGVAVVVHSALLRSSTKVLFLLRIVMFYVVCSELYSSSFGHRRRLGISLVWILHKTKYLNEVLDEVKQCSVRGRVNLTWSHGSQPATDPTSHQFARTLRLGEPPSTHPIEHPCTLRRTSDRSGI